MRFRSPEPKPPAEGARATGLRRVSLVESVAIQLMSEPINTDGLRKVQAAGEGRPVSLPGWPLMLTRAELCQYLGVSWSTLKRVLTVAPVDMGANVIRYSRDQIDAWVASRPALGRARPRARAPRIEEIPSDCAADALERARRRGSKR